ARRTRAPSSSASATLPSVDSASTTISERGARVCPLRLSRQSRRTSSPWWFPTTAAISAAIELLERVAQSVAQTGRIVLADDVRVTSPAHLEEPSAVVEQRLGAIRDLVGIEAGEDLAAA